MNPRVVFVDDEPRLLQGLRRSLYARGSTWRAEFVESAAAALVLLEKEPCDAIVTDMQMMPMNGADLLGEVRERWPATLRFVLSGHVATESAVHALQVAHQLLSKPCDVGVLVAAVERGIAVQNRLSTTLVRATLGRLKTLPAAPRVHARMAAALIDPQCDARTISNILDCDPALSANVLHLANSAFFTCGGRVSSNVRHAVARIGLATVSDLVLATEVFDLNAQGPHSDAMRDRAIHASRIAAMIARGGPYGAAAPTAALLADVGYLLPGVEEIDVSGDPASLSAHAHAELGASLLGLWAIPMPIVEAVANHHAPSVNSSGFDLPGIVHVAVALASELDPDLDYLEQLGLLDNLPEWKTRSARIGIDPA